MSINVTTNPNGSVTVTCGSDSVTIPGGPSGLSGGFGGSGPSKWPPLSPNGGASTAWLTSKKTGAFTIKNKVVTTTGEIVSTLKAHVPAEAVFSRISDEGPLVLRFGWKATEPLDLSSISEAIRQFGEQNSVYCEIYFLDSDD